MENKTVNSKSGGTLGVSACVFLLVGAMIGSAIYSLSGMTMYVAGPAALLSWLLAGGIMLMQGLSMAELSSRYPKSGGIYVFPRLAFGGRAGRALGWMSCWGSVVTNIIAVAFSAIYVGQYLGVAFPWAAHLQIPLAILSILLCLGVNSLSIGLAGKVNAFAVLVLLGTLIVYVLTGFFGGTYESSQLLPFFSQGEGGAWGFVKAIPVALIGYSGIVALAFIVSDVHNARRTVPVAMLTAIAIVIVIYLLAIAATMGLVTAGYLQEHREMCFIPMFCACFTKLESHYWLQPLLSISAVLALLTTMMMCIAVNARAIQAASEDGIIPKAFARSSRHGTPALANLALCLLSTACACFPQLTMQMVNFGALFNTITIALTMLSFVKARRTAPCPDGVFLAPGGTGVYYVVLAVLIGCNVTGIISGGGANLVFTVVVMGAGLLLLLRRAHK